MVCCKTPQCYILLSLNPHCELKDRGSRCTSPTYMAFRTAYNFLTLYLLLKHSPSHRPEGWIYSRRKSLFTNFAVLRGSKVTREREREMLWISSSHVCYVEEAGRLPCWWHGTVCMVCGYVTVQPRSRVVCYVHSDWKRYIQDTEGGSVRRYLTITLISKDIYIGTWSVFISFLTVRHKLHLCVEALEESRSEFTFF
jgi:hypothetical protein